MAYLWWKAVHIIGVVSWFAGLFYLVRLFIYHAEANAAPEPARSILMRQYARRRSPPRNQPAPYGPLERTY